jgi:superkiller protein 3
MSGKAALKAVRTALDSKDFEGAATKANELVERDPANYHAYGLLNISWANTQDNANADIHIPGTFS